MTEKSDRKGELGQIISSTRNTLREFKSNTNAIIVGAFIYGSFAKGTFTNESDLDVALLTDGTFTSFGTIESEFARRLKQNGVQRKIHVFPLLDVNNKELVENIKEDMFNGQFIEVF